MAIFRPLSPNPTGSNPVSNAVADVDGDGNLDLLVTNYISDNISVLLGDGHGGFTSTLPVPVTNGPRSVVTGDLDGDGDLDFLATNYSGGNVTVGLNDGAGSFTTSSVTVGVVPRGLATADLDGDGDLDFVAVNYSGNTVSVGLNGGDGTFPGFAAQFGTGGNRPVQTVIADFNGDGRPDLAVTNNSNNTVGILFNNGDGSFAAPVTAAAGAGPRGITAGDVDGDGFADLVVTNFSAGSVSILRNDGTGHFGAPATYTTANNPYDVKLGDLDGDGDLDMVVSNSGSSSVGVFFNDGAGTFAQEALSPFGVGISPGGLSLADFDGDGDLDIATSNFGSNNSHILLNTMATYSVAATSAVEGTATGTGGELVFTITRTATSEAEDVTYTLDGTASAGSDYTVPGSLSVSFAAGQQTATIRIAVTPDLQVEGDESLSLTLVATSGEGRISAHAGSATGMILNDDLPNRAPAGADRTIALAEDGSRVLAVSDFGFSDPDGDALSAVRITSLPGAGQLTLNGVAVSAGQTISVADIMAGDLVFRPAANGHGAAYASLDFRVQDDGGQTMGGVDLDPTANRLTFDVAAVNDAPVLIGDLRATVREGGSHVLTSADLGFSDPDDTGAGVVFRVSAPVHGAVLVNGRAAGSFTAADIAAGRVSFAHDGSETGSASFRVLVEDGNEDGSAPVPRSFALGVTAVNDAPVLHVSPLVGRLAEDVSTAAGIKVASLSVTDPDGGANHLSLTGADARLFEIRNGGVWLKAGAALDFESNPVLDLAVQLDDPGIGSGPEGRQPLRIAITDVVEGLTGTNGNDRLIGGGASETLTGRAGNDLVSGGGGNDVLIGGAGVDTMRGGAGRDSFVFVSAGDSAPGYSGYINNGPLNPLSGAGHRDLILDFTHGQDRIDLSRIDANPALAGDQAFVWRGTGNLSMATADVVFRQFDAAGTDHDRTIIYGDQNHDGRADFQIELAGLVDLGRDDFIL